MNVIIGLATGYAFENIRIFIHSLWAIKFSGAVVLYADNDLHIPDLYRKGLNIIIIDEKSLRKNFIKRALTKVLSIRILNKLVCNILLKMFRSGNSQFLPLYGHLYHCLTSRFAFYLDFLKHSTYENVLLTDTRDVVFQSDPFTGFNDSLAVFQDSPLETIRTEAFNAGWIRRAFGEKVFDEIADHKIYCAGTIMGKRDGMVKFLECFVETCIKQAVPFNRNGMDQAVLNYMVHSDRSNDIRAYDHGQIVLTATDDILNRYAFHENALLVDGKKPAIVHQYDRTESWTEFFEKVNW